MRMGQEGANRESEALLSPAEVQEIVGRIDDVRLREEDGNFVISTPGHGRTVIMPDRLVGSENLPIEDFLRSHLDTLPEAA